MSKLRLFKALTIAGLLFLSFFPLAQALTYQQIVEGQTGQVLGASTISPVSGQNKGEIGTGSLANLAFANSVTSGNQVIVTVEAYGGSTPTIDTPPEAAGTATLSSFTQDATYQNNSGSNYFKISVYRATVTGSGSLTIGFSGTFSYSLAAINEYSGMAASPLDGSFVTNTATGNTESTGNITTTAAAGIVPDGFHRTLHRQLYLYPERYQCLLCRYRQLNLYRRSPA